MADNTPTILALMLVCAAGAAVTDGWPWQGPQALPLLAQAAVLLVQHADVEHKQAWIENLRAFKICILLALVLCGATLPISTWCFVHVMCCTVAFAIADTQLLEQSNLLNKIAEHGPTFLVQALAALAVAGLAGGLQPYSASGTSNVVPLYTAVAVALHWIAYVIGNEHHRVACACCALYGLLLLVAVTGLAQGPQYLVRDGATGALVVVLALTTLPFCKKPEGSSLAPMGIIPAALQQRVKLHSS